MAEALRGALQKISALKSAFLYGNFPTQEKILPRSALNALEYKGTVHGAKEINDLLLNGLVAESQYLFLRGLNNQPAEQIQALEGMTTATLRSPESLTDLRSYLQEQLQKYPEIQTPSVKLGQINRQGGFEYWHALYREKAEKIKNHPDSPSPVLIAYASLVGLSDFINVFQESNTPLFITIPQWLQDEHNENAGYEINLQNSPKVVFLAKDSFRPENIITVVDTRKTGSLEKNIWKFWTHKDDVSIDTSRMFSNVHVPQLNGVFDEEG